jgi:hypothetical protein
MAKVRLRYKVPGKDEVIEEVEDLNDAIKHWEAIWERDPWVILDECELEEEKDGEWLIWEDEDGWTFEEWVVYVDMDRAAKSEDEF